MMVDDDDVALESALVHQRDETPLEVGALLAGTEIRARINFGPRAACFRKRRNFRAVAKLGGLLPLLDDLKIRQLFESRENRFSVGVVNLLAAGVIVPPLHVTDLKRA